MTGGIFPKGLVRKNRICDMNHGHDKSDAEKKFRWSIPEGSREEKHDL
jgi:hypothetical protein